MGHLVVQEAINGDMWLMGRS